jgi:CelD/BcsL family acetyltransferase involved in cellulose biosynthesis
LTAFRSAGAAIDIDRAALPLRWIDLTRDFAPNVTFRIYTDLASVEAEWRRFEQHADGTPFQTFEWLATWQRHVGTRNGVTPAIVVGRFGDGATAFIFPFGVETSHAVRCLRWFGHDLCDYNAPLIAPDFSDRITRERFLLLWDELRAQMQSNWQLRHDWIEFDKMPQTLGAQINPFTYLRVSPNASSAHITQLGSDWESFYRAKRSSATRRHDRSKRKRMAKFGEVRFTSAAEAGDIRQTLDILWEQKKRIFARKGIGDLFARPGYREFFADFATNAASRHLVHVSRVEVGSTCAAANFGLVFGDCYYHVLSSYCDGQIAHYGPGALHLRDLLSYAIGRGLRRFDFTIGDEHYKSEWCEVQLHLCDYSAAVHWRGLPDSAASRVRRRLKRFIKQTPPIWQLVTQLRSAYGALTAPRAK